MTGASQNKLSKKQQRKRVKQQEKRWKRINDRIDKTIARCVLLIAIGIVISEVLEAMNRTN